MRNPDRRAMRMASWVAAGAAVLSAAALLKRRSPAGSAGRDAFFDDQSGRGRTTTPASPAARAAGHETGDMRGGLMAKLALLLGAVAFCMVFAMIGLRVWITTAQQNGRPALTRIQTAIITPPNPQLQRDPLAQIADFEASQARQLDGFGFLEGSRTRAHIPIDRAMALTVGQPLAPPP